MTNAVRGYVRDPSSGAGINGVTVALKVHNGSTTVASDDTDANGLYELGRDTVGYPGPTFQTFTSGSTTDISSGNVVGQIAGLIWGADIPDMFALLGIGVGSGLAVSADGADMTSDIAAGVALLKDGMPYVQEGVQAVTHTTADATNPRIDRVVLRLTREGQTDQGKIERVVIAGTPAASPTAPAVTQTAATWDFQLAQVRVNAGVTTIAADKVTDERTILASPTELAYLVGVTSGIQAQLNAKQPLDSDLTTLAANITAAGHALVDDADATTQRTTLGLAIGSDVQAYSALLAAIVSAGEDFALDRIAFAIESAAAATTASTASTATYAEALSVDLVLPAGTWTIIAWGDVKLVHNASSTVDCRINIGGADAGTSMTGTVGSAATDRQTFSPTHIRTGVASATIAITIEYKSNGAGTTSASQPRVIALAFRTA